MFNDNTLLNLINGINEKIITNNLEMKNCLKNTICFTFNISSEKIFNVYCENSPELFFKNGMENFNIYWDDKLINLSNKKSDIILTSRGVHTLKIKPINSGNEGEILLCGGNLKLR